jgi:hypothetical protein
MGYKKLLIKQDCVDSMVLLRVFGDRTQPLSVEHRSDPLLVQWWRCLQRIEVEFDHVKGHQLDQVVEVKTVDNIDPCKLKKQYNGLVDFFLKGSLENSPEEVAVAVAKPRKFKRIQKVVNYADAVANSHADRMARNAAISGQSKEARERMERCNPMRHNWPLSGFIKGSWLQREFGTFLNLTMSSEQQVLFQSVLQSQERQYMLNKDGTVCLPPVKKIDVGSLKWSVLQDFWFHNPQWLIALHDSTKPLFPQCH